jgi:7-carboxy-7-deazaguanine synthase
MAIITEIFRSIQGESSAAGYPAVFVRFTGCNLRCRYCDTTYAYSGGMPMSISSILAKIRTYPRPQHICLTGGEPLAQDDCPTLTDELLSDGYAVRIETNGSFDIGVVSNRASRIVDVKTPSSGEEKSFVEKNIPQLTPHDELKFVIAGKADIDFTNAFIGRFGESINCPINISPAEGAMTAAQCVSFILDSGINARLNLQLHKIIWPKGEPK